MAHKKAGGSTALGRDSHGQRLGIKITNGDVAKPGAIIVRQRGSHIRPGAGVMKGNDDSIFSVVSGIVHFYSKKRTDFTGKRTMNKFVEVVDKLPEVKEIKAKA